MVAKKWKDYAQYDLCDTGVYLRGVINFFFLVGQLFGLVKKFNIGIY